MENINEDVLPGILLYRKYLNIASIRFNKTLDEIRDLYGLYTIKEWNDLLNK